VVDCDRDDSACCNHWLQSALFRYSLADRCGGRLRSRTDLACHGYPLFGSTQGASSGASAFEKVIIASGMIAKLGEM